MRNTGVKECGAGHIAPGRRVPNFPPAPPVERQVFGDGNLHLKPCPATGPQSSSLGHFKFPRQVGGMPWGHTGRSSVQACTRNTSPMRLASMISFVRPYRFCPIAHWLPIWVTTLYFFGSFSKHAGLINIMGKGVFCK